MRHFAFALASAIVLSLPGVGAAQSLAEVARAAVEKNREATATGPAKVYTNKDLAKVPDAPTPTAPSDPPPAPVTPPAGSPGTTEVPEKTESYWRDRMRPLQEQLDRDRRLAAASKLRADALAAQADNCFRIGVVCAEYIESLRERTEHERLLADVERDEREVRALQEEARRAGVPPGWLRP